MILAALAANELGLLPALTRSRIELASMTARKELAWVERFARDPKNEAQKRALRHLAACATMERGFTPQELERAMGEELTALKITWPDGSGDLAAVLPQALAGVHLPVAPVEPDRGGHQARHGEPLLAATETLIRAGLTDAEQEVVAGHRERHARADRRTATTRRRGHPDHLANLVQKAGLGIRDALGRGNCRGGRWRISFHKVLNCF